MSGFRSLTSSLRHLSQFHTKQLIYRANKKNVLISKHFQNINVQFTVNRSFTSTNVLKTADEEYIEKDADEEDTEVNSEEDFINRYLDPKDRTREVPPEISIKYMESVAFKTTYGDNPVWLKYRRNFPGNRLPLKTRETCIRQGKIETGSPCPICRDQYLVVDYRNKALLKHFLDPYTGQVLHPNKTHICQKQWRKLKVHMEIAKDHGYLDVDVPRLEYNYNEYVPK